MYSGPAQAAGLETPAWAPTPSRWVAGALSQLQVLLPKYSGRRPPHPTSPSPQRYLTLDPTKSRVGAHRLSWNAWAGPGGGGAGRVCMCGVWAASFARGWGIGMSLGRVGNL